MGFSPDLQRHFDAHRLNEIANHPEVRPTCGGDGKSLLDFASFVSNPKNYALVWDQGALLFHWSAPYTYEVHVMVLPEGRGKDAYHTIKKGIEDVLSLGAERIWARVADGFDGLRHITAQMGFTKCGSDLLDIGSGPITYELYQREKRCLQLS